MREMKEKGGAFGFDCGPDTDIFPLNSRIPRLGTLGVVCSFSG